MVNRQNEVVLNHKHQKQGRNFAMHSDFRYIAKISLYSEKMQDIAKTKNFARNSNFH